MSLKAALSGGSVIIGNEECAVQYASISTAASGATQLVAAVAGKRTRVLAYFVQVDGTVAFKFQSNATDLTGLMSMTATATVPCAPGFCPLGHFQTATNEPLNINLNLAIGVRGHLTYVQYTA